MNDQCLTEATHVQRCDFTTVPTDFEGKRILANNISLMVKDPVVVAQGMSEWLHGARILINQETSPTLIAFGTLREVEGCSHIVDVPVVVKCFISDVSPKHQVSVDGLNYESAVYACVVANITSAPFFVFPYAVFEKQPNMDDEFEYHVSNQLHRLWRATTAYPIAPRRRNARGSVCKYIVMENCGNRTLSHHVHACDGSTFIKLSLQMLSALKTLQDNLITHNDLHWRNVLVKLDAPAFCMDATTGKVVETAVYPADGTVADCVVKMERGTLVKIFDWDAAVAHRVGDNPKTHELQMHTKRFKKMYDTIGFLKTWHATALHSPWRNNPDNTEMNERCLEAYHESFGELEVANPWVFSTGKGGFTQSVCLPSQRHEDDDVEEGEIRDDMEEGEIREDDGSANDYDDDCEQKWPPELDLKLEKQVAFFTWRLTRLLPRNHLARRVDR